MEEKMDEQQTTRLHDERVFRGGDAIFSQDDLRNLINIMYSEYQYKGTQQDKLAALIDFLALESNRYREPDLAVQSELLRNFLDNLQDFLKKNFYQWDRTADGETIFLFRTEKTSSENEAFLMELQLLSLDVENAYRRYRAAVISKLQL